MAQKSKKAEKPKPLAVMVCGFNRAEDVWREGLEWRNGNEQRELWTFNPLGRKRYDDKDLSRMPDRHFEIHPMEVHRLKQRYEYIEWIEERADSIRTMLRGLDEPEPRGKALDIATVVYTQDGGDDAHGALAFPIGSPEMLALPRGGVYHAGTVDMLVAFALTLKGEDKVGRIIIRGMNYDTGKEPYSARACLEYWCGVAEGRGVKVDTALDGDDRQPRILSNTARFGGGSNDIDFRNPLYGYDVCHMGELGQDYAFARQRCPLWSPESARRDAYSDGYHRGKERAEEDQARASVR